MLSVRLEHEICKKFTFCWSKLDLNKLKLSVPKPHKSNGIPMDFCFFGTDGFNWKIDYVNPIVT